MFDAKWFYAQTIAFGVKYREVQYTLRNAADATRKLLPNRILLRSHVHVAHYKPNHGRDNDGQQPK